MAADRTYEASWVDLEEPDVSENDLRLRGAEKGAAIFARGEGICYADGETGNGGNHWRIATPRTTVRLYTKSGRRHRDRKPATRKNSIVGRINVRTIFSVTLTT